MKRLRGCECHGSGALDNVHGNDGAARRRSQIHRRSWTIAWLNQKSSVLETQMGLGAPGRNQGLRPRLYPPWSTPGVEDDLLTRASDRKWYPRCRSHPVALVE